MISVRPAVGEDDANLRRAIVELQEHERQISTTRLPGEQIADRYLAWLHAQVAVDGAILIAECDGDFAGFVACRIRAEDYPAETPASNRFGYISDICVMPPWRGRGIAGRLLAAAERHLARSGIDRLRIVSLANNAAARAAYARSGFAPYEISFEKPLGGPAQPSSEEPIGTIRRAYAKQMLAVAGADGDARLEAAFAAVQRERFIGSPPWQIRTFAGGYHTLPSADPVLAYQDVLFSLAPKRAVNNGSPSLHAHWLHHLAPAPGGRVAHIGAGTGYYTALLAELVGPHGHVLAIEYDPDLAERARANLAERNNVAVLQDDGALWPRDATDCIYVNFAVTRPADAWIEKLVPGGRLVFPLGVPGPLPPGQSGQRSTHGAGFLIERRDCGFAARSLGPAFFVWAAATLASATDEAVLRTAFERGGTDGVKSFIWKQPFEPEHCWFATPDWALCYNEPA